MNKSTQLQVLLFLAQHFLVLSIFIQSSGQGNKKILCPSVCNHMACEMGILTCSESGLTELPKTPPPNTTKVLMINHDFSKSSTLSEFNFSEYRSPLHNVTKITIQNCSLRDIMSYTFRKLLFLETVDLSFNKLREIKEHTFAGLKLKFLRLDGNEDIKLSALSFQGLDVGSLSLIDCQLAEISYLTLEPIASYLRRLMLSKNRLKTIESRFENLFQRLELIGLEGNQFDCSHCSLFWLISSMKSKILKNTQTLLFPRCQSPLHLKDRFIHELASNDLECPKPSVHVISIVILPNNSATLTCTASDVQSQVVWTQLYSTNNTVLPYNQPTDNILLSEAAHSTNLLVNQRQLVDVFSCTVTSPLGNRSSTKLQISWPKIRSKQDSPELSNFYPTIVSKDRNSKTYFFQPQFSLIEMIAGVIGTFIGTLILFIAMLRCIFYRMKFFTKSSQLRDHQVGVCVSKKEKLKHYMTYEAPLYSDSQTYDIPTLLPNVNQSSLVHFIDFKTQQTVHDRNNK